MFSFASAFLLLFYLCAPPLTGASSFLEESDLEEEASPSIQWHLFSHSHLQSFLHTEGSQAKLQFKLEVPSKHYGYLNRLKLRVSHPKEFYIDSFKVNPKVEFWDSFSGKKQQGIKGVSFLHAYLRWKDSIEGSLDRMDFELTYQLCTKKICYLPQTVKQSFHFNANSKYTKKGSKEKKSAYNMKENKNSSSRLVSLVQGNSFLSNLLQKKSYLYIFIAIFLAGLLASFSPCILPALPLTLAVLRAHGSQTKIKRPSSLHPIVIYTLGMVLTYSFLGLLASSTGQLFGAFFQHPLILFSFSLLFLFMSLSLLDLFHLQLPSRWQQFLNKKQDLFLKNSSQKVWLMLAVGALAALLASPCVSPVLLALLTYVGQEQNLLLGFSLLFVFALGFGQIFLLLGLGHKGLSFVPFILKKISPFTKPILALALLAVGLYYLSLSFPKTLHWTQNRFLPSPIKWQSDYANNLPKPQTQTGQTEKMEQARQTEKNEPTEPIKQAEQAKQTESIKQKGAQQPKPFLLYFYADWCLSCLQIEWSYFRNKDIVQTSRQFSMIKVNVDDPKATSLLRKYRIKGIPAIIFVSKRGLWRSDLTVRGFGHLNKREMLSHMQKALHSKP